MILHLAKFEKRDIKKVKGVFVLEISENDLIMIECKKEMALKGLVIVANSLFGY